MNLNFQKNIDGPTVLDNSQDVTVTMDYRVKTTTMFDSATGKKIGGTVEIESDWPIPEDECERICDEVIAGMK